MYTLKKLRRLYLTKVAVIFTIATFLINQAIEALVVAEIFPVWSLQFSLITTAITFPFVMYIAYVIIYKKVNSSRVFQNKPQRMQGGVMNLPIGLTFTFLICVDSSAKGIPAGGPSE